MSAFEELLEAWKSEDALWFTPPASEIDVASLQILVNQANRGAPDLVWFSSSGSTSDGGLKFLGHRRERLEKAARSSNMHLETTSKDHALNVLPLFHVGGFSTWLRAKVGRYSWTHLEMKWSASKFAEALEEEGATLTSMVPTQIHDVVAAGLKCPSHLRAVIVGGGRLSLDLYRNARRLGWPLLPSYGLTEMGSQVATATLESLTSEDYPTLRWLPHIDGMGRSASGRYFIEGESSAFAEALLAADGMFTLELKTRDGRLLIDDELVVDEDARTLKVLGRRTRVVKIKGELVSLDGVQAELEEFLAKDFPALSSTPCVIQALPHSREENELILLLELNPSAADFRAWKGALSAFNTITPGYKFIKRFEFIPLFERTALGKIKISSLSSPFESK